MERYLTLFLADKVGARFAGRISGVTRFGLFVALDETGRPTPVPPWTPVTDTDRALQAYALRLIELRKLMDADMESHLAELERAER